MTELSSLAADLVRAEGAIARQAGEPQKANPYPKGREERRLWVAGWKAGSTLGASVKGPNLSRPSTGG